MKYRAILYHGADECFSCHGDDLLAVLQAAGRAMAKERQGRKGRCDGGTVFQDGATKYTLVDEHWV